MTRTDTDKAQEAAPGASRAQRTSEPSLDTVAIRGLRTAVSDRNDLLINQATAWETTRKDAAYVRRHAKVEIPLHHAEAILTALSQAQARVSLLEGVLGELLETVYLCPDDFEREDVFAAICSDARSRARAALSEATLDGVGKDEEACSPSALDAPVSAPSGGSASPLEDQ